MNDPEVLSTIVVTAKERAILARALTVAAALVDALGDDTGDLLRLWERIACEGEEPLL